MALPREFILSSSEEEEYEEQSEEETDEENGEQDEMEVEDFNPHEVPLDSERSVFYHAVYAMEMEAASYDVCSYHPQRSKDTRFYCFFCGIEDCSKASMWYRCANHQFCGMHYVCVKCVKPFARRVTSHYFEPVFIVKETSVHYIVGSMFNHVC